MIKKIWAVTFSPTGNTAAIAFAAASAAAKALTGLDTASAAAKMPAGLDTETTVERLDISLPAAREKELRFCSGELVFLGLPVYAGRVPNKIMPFIRDMVKGDGAFGVPIVTFGGRSFDDGLAELSDLMAENGFSLAGGGAFVCQHAFAQVASDRPDAGDLQRAAALGAGAAENLHGGRILSAADFPGNHPAGPYYIPKGTDGQPAVFLKAKPQLRAEACLSCGRCAEVCPMGSIEPDTLRTAGICIKCQACITGCPAKARYFDDPAFLSHRAMLEESFGSLRRESITIV